MKTNTVEDADRHVRNIVSQKSSGRTSTRSRKSRTSIMDNGGSKKGEKDFNATALQQSKSILEPIARDEPLTRTPELVATSIED